MDIKAMHRVAAYYMRLAALAEAAGMHDAAAIHRERADAITTVAREEVTA